MSYKTGGRTKGTLNKATLTIRERLKAMDIDPLEGLAEIANQARIDGNLELAYKCYKDLLPYCYSKAEGVIAQLEAVKETETKDSSVDFLQQLIADTNKKAAIKQEPNEVEILQTASQEELIEN